MIIVKQEMILNSRTPTHGSKWRATSEIGGKTYAAESRSGAPQALARMLVKAGIPDQEVSVKTTLPDGQGITMRYRSMHEMAGRTFSESATHPLSEIPFSERPDFLRGEGENDG